MARNHEKYVYAELAIPRNSAWYLLLVAEAEAKGLPLSQVALERLAATYLTKAQSGTPAPPTSKQLAAQSASGPAAEAALEDDTDPELSAERAANNAAAFLDNNGGFF